MFKKYTSRLRRFRRDDEGSVIVESVIMLPLLFSAILATFVFFDAFRNQSINVKASYTLSDALSREDNLITNTYMINLWRVHRFLTNSPSLTKLRVTAVQYIADENDPTIGEYHVVWSRNKGGAGDMNNSQLQGMVGDDKIPVMPDGEVLIIVQTWVDYEPNFAVGLETFSFENTVFTRPRDSPRMFCYSHNGTIAGRICPIGS